MTVLKIKDTKTNEWISIQTIRGEKGETGPQGPAGTNGTNGKDGVDGKDGTDYVLTESDKQEIADLVLAELPSSEEVSY